MELYKTIRLQTVGSDLRLTTVGLNESLSVVLDAEADGSMDKIVYFAELKDAVKGSAAGTVTFHEAEGVFSVQVESGVPAALVSGCIYRQGIVPTRTTDFQLMFLFSMGITKGKWGTLLNALLNFKRLYDTNAPVRDVLPELAAAYPEVYGKTGLHDLGDRMFDCLKREKPGEKLNAAFSTLPVPAMTPRKAYEKIVTGDVEIVPADRLAGRIAANSVIPYPPGIPLLMSGENFGPAESPQIRYLQALTMFDREFPGFEHETEGAEVRDGVYCVMCVRK